VLYRFANANLANLNYCYRGTSPHCSNCLVAAEATGLRLQVLRSVFSSLFFLSLLSASSDGDEVEREVQLATSRGHGLAGGWRARAVYKCRGHRLALYTLVLCCAAQRLCVQMFFFCVCDCVSRVCSDRACELRACITHACTCARVSMHAADAAYISCSVCIMCVCGVL
jgi:hypothetical protein